MNRDRNALKAGIFIIVSFIAAVAAVVLIRGDGTGATQIHVVEFSLTDDLDGLREGDDVRIGGTKVGSVRNIELVGMDSTPKVRITFSMPAIYVLKENAEIGVTSALAGPASLNISSFGAGNPVPATTAFSGKPDAKKTLFAALGRAAPDIEAMVGDIKAKTLPNVNEGIVSANALIHHIDQKVDPVVDEYTKVTTKTAVVIADVHDLIGDSNSKPTDLRATMKNLKDATATLPPLMKKITAAVDDADAAIASTKASLEDVEKILSSARSILGENRSRIDSMVKSLKTTGDNLKATSIEVRHSPWRLLYHPGANEVGNLTLYDSARQFSEGAASMSDAAAALRDAMKDPHVDKADKERLQKLVDNLDKSFKDFRDAESKLWTSVK